jgi:hypothetical protein
MVPALTYAFENIIEAHGGWVIKLILIYQEVKRISPSVLFLEIVKTKDFDTEI